VIVPRWFVFDRCVEDKQDGVEGDWSMDLKHACVVDVHSAG
jgi:hypothetical protein